MKVLEVSCLTFNVYPFQINYKDIYTELETIPISIMNLLLTFNNNAS